MGQKAVYITKEGLAHLEAELEHLISSRRPEIAEKIKQAREAGTENNVEYDDAKNDQAFVEGRILILEDTIRNAAIIESPESPGIVDLGNTVLIHNQDGKIEQFTIVGSTEADPVNGKISNESPVGRALLGKRVGDEIEVAIPAGAVLKLSIMEVS